MNILLTNDAVDIAGGENYVLFLAEGLKEKGHKVFIAPLKNSKLAEISLTQGYKTFEIPYAVRGKEFSAAYKIISSIKEKNINIIHSNSNLDRTIASFAAKFLGIKHVAQIHSAHSISHNMTHVLRNKYLINHFITDGYQSKKILVEEDKIPDDKISVVHIGIDEKIVKTTHEKKEKIVSEFNIKSGDIVIGSISRLVPFKGHLNLIEAIKPIVEKFPNVKLIIVGDGELLEKLKNETINKGLENNIIFTGYRNDLAEIFSVFDFVVHPSIDFGGESFPIVLLMSIAAKKPVIASNVGDISYQIKNGENGFLIKPGDVNELTNKIIELVNNRELINSMSKKSYEIYSKNYTLPIMTEKIEDIYNKILNK